MPDNVQPNQAHIHVRTFEDRDQSAVSWLYTNGLLAGQIASNDTGADIDNVREAYFSENRNHFWVAEAAGQVVGMIGVAHDQGHVAEIRRLRVHPDYQKVPAVAQKLFEFCLHHCRHHNYLKLVLDTRFEASTMMPIFDKLGFQHTRTKSVQGKDLLEFYLDLYRQPKPGE
ncbi:MAG: GNAT family N-acetyltransferase [Phycisphaera sp.]|nr:GNAT family N-acetyltransferase [Phycisphaera sp.]